MRVRSRTHVYEKSLNQFGLPRGRLKLLYAGQVEVGSTSETVLENLKTDHNSFMVLCVVSDASIQVLMPNSDTTSAAFQAINSSRGLRPIGSAPLQPCLPSRDPPYHKGEGGGGSPIPVF